MRRTGSLKSTILWRLVPGLIFFVVSTGIISYILSSQQLKSNAYANIYDTVSQTKNYLNDRLELLLSAVVDLSKDPDLTQILIRADDPGFEQQPNDYIVLKKAFDQIYSKDYYDMVDSVVLWYNEGTIAIQRTDYMAHESNFQAGPYLNRAASGSSTIFWNNLHQRDISYISESGSNVASVFQWIGRDRANPQGVYLVNIKEQFFRKILLSPRISDNGSLLLVSPDGVMRFKPVSEQFEIDEKQLQSDLLEAPGLFGRLDMKSRNGSKMVVIYDTIGANRWKIAALFPEDELLRKVNYIKYMNFLVILGAILFAIIFSTLLANYITKPIRHLTHQVNRIEEGNLNVLFKQWPQQEMTVLNKGLKEMVERIKALIRQVEEEQDTKRRIEISLLHSQIQPHFLYNTLFSIKQLYDMGETKDASKMITALSTFFRISLSKGDEVITIASELEQIQTYLFIQQMRYGKAFSYEIDVDPDILPCSIVKLTLQPIVENAIYHGLKLKPEQGLIRISGYTDDEDIYFFVEENGVGMTPEKLKEITEGLSDGSQTKTGFGTVNVHKRLQMYYGDGYGLQYQSELGKGTLITIKIRRVPGQPISTGGDITT
ncbi:HAMP domain-containing protein [Paenibacillus sp. LMG 31456]|uniref:histidine kinase n=1 Tax=Paenibacillus foliorum TaxID=2654974 RepID=A0A972GTD7_9BACL|nr:sensor histidine kinase [Paenibacillus foliorum]NOU96387.1 HAMP domain-containing protein [Paenibacillus foliorum]